MNIESFQDYCLAKAGVTEEFPFGEETMVYKVMGKMFALTSLDSTPFSKYVDKINCYYLNLSKLILY
jgi:predicted DNA-binding protein (MmcQ/YjbR family)